MHVRTALVIASAAAVAAPLVSMASLPTDPLSLATLTAARLGTTLVPGPEPLSSANVDLVATIPGTYIGMRKVGKHLVATGVDGLSTFDISDPTLPRPLAVLPIAHFENENVAPLDLAGLTAYAAEHDLERGERDARIGYGEQRAAHGYAVEWPPARNEPCWCGSGSKYKKCCGRPAAM